MLKYWIINIGEYSRTTNLTVVSFDMVFGLSRLRPENSTALKQKQGGAD